MTEYDEKLKDPRWQKKRLEVFERDGWCCQSCYDCESTLHVHHLYYEKDKDPWDYPLEAFSTLCEECHDYEHSCRKSDERYLLKTLKEQGFYAADVRWIGNAFSELRLGYPNHVVTSIIMWAFSSHFEKLCNDYFAQLKGGSCATKPND